MTTDTEIKLKGSKALATSLGHIGDERFISLIQRELFDCTKWQRDLWDDQSVEEISRKAMKVRKALDEQNDGTYP
ncbi:MAG: hypothetical protein C4549_00455 [Deltaproteobacteria bacterium]|jgi:hypothetical protein|nr:MAG: hypothetical protein C4549_00455 [Deltaproteobacteria bacterium]